MKDGVEGVLKLVEVVRVTGRKFGMEGEREREESMQEKYVATSWRKQEVRLRE